MLGLGWTEMLVIGVVALIFIGPKDLPVVMGRVGKVIGQVQRMGRDFQREINKTTGLDEVRNLRTSITSPLKKTADEIRKEFNAIGTDGQAKPSGALKPTDPNTESVVEAIQQQAGMIPAAKKTSTELAADYGFGASKTEPVKAARKSTKPPSYADTETAKAAAAKAEAEAEAANKKAPAKKPGAAKPAKAASPGPATAKATTGKAAPAKSSTAKTAAKPARKPATAKAAPAAAAPKPAAKARAPRKKPADTAGKSE